MLVLTTAIEADRTGRRYGHKVDPDEVVPGVNGAARVDDETVAAAVRWLKGATACGK
jgi:hypothetical protein